MDSNKQHRCNCELCQPNYYMGWDGGFMPEQPEPQPEKVEDQKPVARPVKVKVPLIPVLAN